MEAIPSHSSTAQNQVRDPCVAVPELAGEMRAASGELLAIVALALVVALSVRGHFVMPHPDFFEFLDSGHAMLQGELPPTMKRGPVYSLFVPILGLFISSEAPERTAAEWLNVALLPANAILIYLIGLRWSGRAATWAAAIFLLMPMSAYCTSHLIVEPMLVFLVLLAVWLRTKFTSNWSYAVAALATMTRYDAAGLIAGLALADMIERRPKRRAFMKAGAALLPLTAWLALTAATWTTRSYDHYLSQIGQRSTSEILAAFPGAMAESVRLAFWAIFDASGDSHRLLLPSALLALDEPIRMSIFALVVGLTLIGALRVVVRHDAAGVTALVALTAYFAAHAIFPFQFHRFGYPPSAIFILFAAAGAAWVVDVAAGKAKRPAAPDDGRRTEPTAEALASRVNTASSCNSLADERQESSEVGAQFRGNRLSHRLSATVGALCILLLVVALRGEAEALGALGGASHRWSISLTVLKLAAVAVLWAATTRTAGLSMGRVAVLLSAMAFSSLQSRNTIPVLGSGIEGMNQVEAARWVREHAGREARVVSASPGLLRLYVGREPADRFPAFQDISADDWDGIVRECRDSRIEYIIWHSKLKQEHGGYYSDKWRLARFDCLANSQVVRGVTVERLYARFPDLVVVRVLGE